MPRPIKALKKLSSQMQSSNLTQIRFVREAATDLSKVKSLRNEIPKRKDFLIGSKTLSKCYQNNGTSDSSIRGGHSH